MKGDLLNLRSPYLVVLIRSLIVSLLVSYCRYIQGCVRPFVTAMINALTVEEVQEYDFITV